MNRDHGFRWYLYGQLESIKQRMKSKGCCIPGENVVILRVEFYVIFFQVQIELVRPKHLGNFHELIIIVVPMEERLFAEDLIQRVNENWREEKFIPSYHRCKHTP